MPSSLWKDTFREIRKTMGRFFSIFAIVAIGVAFFAGVKASVPDMKYTADAYFDKYNLMDIRLVSTVGFTQEDIDAIQNVDGIEGVDATYTMDALTMVGTYQKTLKIHAIPSIDPNQEDANYINQAILRSGRMPQKSGECLLEESELHDSGLQIGDTITLTSGTDTAITESLKADEYTIVGTTLSPYYLSYEKGTSTIGKGTIDNYIMVLKDDFKSEYFTEVNVTLTGAKAYNSYEDAYFEVTDKVKAALETVGLDCSERRLEEIKKLAKEQYEDGEKAYEEGKQTYQNAIASAKTELANAKQKIAAGESTLATEKQTYETKITETKTQLAEAASQLAAGRETYTQQKAEFENKKPELVAQLSNLENQVATLEEQVASLDMQMQDTQTLLQQSNLTEAERTQLYQQLELLQQQKEQAQTAVAKIQPAIATLRTQLDRADAQFLATDSYLNGLEAQILDGEAELEQAQITAQTQFEQAEQDILNGKVQVAQGQVQLAEQERLGQEELDIAKEKLDKAKLDLEDLPQPQWYVLDRQSHYSYMDYGSVADRMDGIAKVFPVFFFIVAALVCLTTMTRMVEEQRSMIGTMKALGYGKGAIAFKYVFYAFVASVLGSIVGCMVGMYVFPMVIFNAWALMYNLPEINYVMQPILAFSSSFMVIGITMIAAYMAVYKELIEVPSQLMRPKAPKVGKKILLERIPILWKHFSFTQKVTARNIFRYKKRFLMTVIGISGCTALLVAGFGIQDSIGEVVTKQYGDIMQYDVSFNYEKDATVSLKEEVSNHLKADDRFESFIGIGQYNGTVHEDTDSEVITIVVPSDVNDFKNFVSLHTRIGNSEEELPSDAVLISEKLAMNMKVSKGDSISIDNGDGIQREVYIGGVVENYIGHYVYMSPVYYRYIFHISQEDTAVLAKLKQVDTAVEETIGNELMEYDQITSVTFYSGIAESFQETISSLGFVVLVLIIAAGMLAFVVLYNLTNVNISERIREIATIKVLGFYDPEVSAYVYRENIFLTMIGAGCGLLLGIGLHRLIMNLAEMDTIMFGRTITWISFLLSFAITLAFAIIVNLVMYGKLKKVPMVESLKSVE